MYNGFNSKKYIFLLIIICIVFCILIIKAFDYLPDNEVVDMNNNKTAGINTIQTTNILTKDVDETKNENVETDDTEQNLNTKNGVLYHSSDELYNKEQIEEINAPSGSVNETKVYNEEQNIDNSQELSTEEKALRAIINARKLAKSANKSEAMIEYNKVADLTQDSELVAEAYEGIAELYAGDKKYGSALAFATKAYKTSPSLSRELLIAKIYYSAGKSDIAMTRINNMVKRGFTVQE